MKEKLNFGKLKKDDNLEKLVKTMEARTQDKSDSSHLDKRKEIKDERFLAQKERLLEKFKKVDKEQVQEQEQVQVKKRSYGRSMR